METIFNHNPTVAELKELFAFDEKENTMAYGFSILPLSVKEYDKEAKKLWIEIPDIERQYRSGFDNTIIEDF